MVQKNFVGLKSGQIYEAKICEVIVVDPRQNLSFASQRFETFIAPLAARLLLAPDGRPPSSKNPHISVSLILRQKRRCVPFCNAFYISRAHTTNVVTCHIDFLSIDFFAFFPDYQLFCHFVGGVLKTGQ